MCDHRYQIDPLCYGEAYEGEGLTLEDAIRSAWERWRESQSVYRDAEVGFDMFHRVVINEDGAIRYIALLRRS